jgi:hypothetical protein
VGPAQTLHCSLKQSFVTSAKTRIRGTIHSRTGNFFFVQDGSLKLTAPKMKNSKVTRRKFFFSPMMAMVAPALSRASPDTESSSLS